MVCQKVQISATRYDVSDHSSFYKKGLPAVRKVDNTKALYGSIVIVVRQGFIHGDIEKAFFFWKSINAYLYTIHFESDVSI